MFFGLYAVVPSDKAYGHSFRFLFFASIQISRGARFLSGRCLKNGVRGHRGLCTSVLESPRTKTVGATAGIRRGHISPGAKCFSQRRRPRRADRTTPMGIARFHRKQQFVACNPAVHHFSIPTACGAIPPFILFFPAAPAPARPNENRPFPLAVAIPVRLPTTLTVSLISCPYRRPFSIYQAQRFRSQGARG